MNDIPIGRNLFQNFLGNSPKWYKLLILLFLFMNPIVLWLFGPFVAGWVLLLQFIATLAFSLACYPLLPGGLLVLEALFLGLTSPEAMFTEAARNFEVIILLIFMVAGVFFLKGLLLFLFGNILIETKSKTKLALLFCSMGALLSAFLDALTVTAVLITVAGGFYHVYYQVASSATSKDQALDLEKFQDFLRSLVMHGVVGTALGGVCTMVGEPQNLIVAKIVGWDFLGFFLAMAPITIPVVISGFCLCVLLERLKIFGYGQPLPESVRAILESHNKRLANGRTAQEKTKLVIQAIVAALICVSLAFHLAEVGIIGLFAIIILTSFNGVTDEHEIGKAFEESLPFVSLLIVFFGIVSAIHHLHLFEPITNWVLSFEASKQPSILYITNGLLSMISDNVFVATVYINEVKAVFDEGGLTKQQFDDLAIAINTGTNIPSIATPNGQAAFLFLLTSGLAPLIKLTYFRMMFMALPYTLILGFVGWVGVATLL